MKKILLLGGTGLAGQAIYRALQDKYRIVRTAGHHDVKCGWRVSVEEPERLLTILNTEDPDIVISSIRGDFQAQMQFHESLADWLSGKEKRLLFLSTSNVFDGDLNRPHTETDLPAPCSDYGIFKYDCETMLQKKLPGQILIFRPSMIWAPKCPRLSSLIQCSCSGKPSRTWQNFHINITLAEQLGWYADYVLGHGFTGIFHVGTRDTIDYCDFDTMVCKAMHIQIPDFEVEKMTQTSFQAVIPTRPEIPDRLQLTVSEVLKKL